MESYKYITIIILITILYIMDKPKQEFRSESGCLIAMIVIGLIVTCFFTNLKTDSDKDREKIYQKVFYQDSVYVLKSRYRNINKYDTGNFRYIDSLKSIRYREFKVMRYQLKTLNK